MTCCGRLARCTGEAGHVDIHCDGPCQTLFCFFWRIHSTDRPSPRQTPMLCRSRLPSAKSTAKVPLFSMRGVPGNGGGKSKRRLKTTPVLGYVS
jgi:hypothetical protein